MGRGRKRTPVALRALRGNPSGKPLPPSPGLAPAAPDEPDFLDADARQEWRRIVAMLEPACVLTKGDAGIVLAACDAFSIIRRCQRAIADKLTYVSPTGLVKMRPEARLLSDARRQYVSALAELGLTPTARSKVASIPTPDDRDSGIHKFFRPGPNRG